MTAKKEDSCAATAYKERDELYYKADGREQNFLPSYFGKAPSWRSFLYLLKNLARGGMVELRELTSIKCTKLHPRNIDILNQEG